MAKQKLGPQQLAYVEALESGEYRQTTGAFTRHELGFVYAAYCALGVAKVHMPNVYHSQNYADKFYLVTRMNDDYGFSFPVIAKWIRRDPSRFFAYEV